MRYITDWHIHSKFSRACSKDLELPTIAAWCAKKGIDIVATGDWTHPGWFQHLEEHLVEERQGIYRLNPNVGTGQCPVPTLANANTNTNPTEFMLVQEVSQIYKKGDKCRRIHNLVFSPSLETCRKVIAWMNDRSFNLKSDGRPILGIDSEVLYRELKSIDKKIIVIPAHAWTPWYAVFGSKSGFDSIEECFGDMSPYIYAIETGLSSNPAMNWQLSGLDKVVCISNSDAHSPRKLGREANVFEFDTPPTYDDFVRVLKEQDRNHFKYTIEFFPEEGKYHFDGCAACGFSSAPTESKRLGLLCPRCKKPMTLGVEHRVEALADRSPTEVSSRKIPYKSIVPLEEILAECFGVSSGSGKRVQEEYQRLIDQVANEFTLLLDAPIEQIATVATNSLISQAIQRVRDGKVCATPGYDGIFGTVKIFDKEKPEGTKQN
ncbi:DNA helicase UvrD, partial [Candidatus Uhrbacteria bacterium]|nr:DNA helicase UvrD [Candidatus Uhrbacteria bacterium]